jgi:hypothetical protein
MFFTLVLDWTKLALPDIGEHWLAFVSGQGLSAAMLYPLFNLFQVPSNAPW